MVKAQAYEKVFITETINALQWKKFEATTPPVPAGHITLEKALLTLPKEELILLLLWRKLASSFISGEW